MYREDENVRRRREDEEKEEEEEARSKGSCERRGGIARWKGGRSETLGREGGDDRSG